MGGQWSAAALARSTAVLVVVSVLFSGCVGGGGKKSANVNAPAPEAKFDESTGGIEGTVFDDEQVPVPGAQVGIDALSIRTVTDFGGRYSFSNVPPGTYEMAATALGFNLAVQTIEVRAGGVTKQDIDITKAASVEPYHITQSKRGLFGCGTSWRPAVQYSGIAVCGVLGIADEVGVNTSAYDRFLIVWKLPNSTAGGWNASVFEMQWTSSQLFGKGLSFIWEVEGCSNVRSMLFARNGGRSPLQANASGAVINRVIAAAPGVDPDDCTKPAERCNPQLCIMHSRVFSQPDTFGSTSAADVGITVQQPFEQYHTSFYNAPPPDGFSALK